MRSWFVSGAVLAGMATVGCAARAPDLTADQLRGELLAVRERNRLLKEEVSICGVDPAPAGLLVELNQVLSPVGAQVGQRGHATIVTLGADLLFNDPFDQKLRDDADARLDLLATALLLHPELDIAVVGHTGTSPIPRAYRKAYTTFRQQSLAMADTLTRYLESHYEIASRRFVVAGRGAQSPIDRTGAGRADPNYRIEIMLYRTGEPPPGPL
ncbi:MAG: OmpA family protein [Myxococcota bacterium]